MTNFLIGRPFAVPVLNCAIVASLSFIIEVRIAVFQPPALTSTRSSERLNIRHWCVIDSLQSISHSEFVACRWRDDSSRMNQSIIGHTKKVNVCWGMLLFQKCHWLFLSIMRVSASVSGAKRVSFPDMAKKNPNPSDTNRSVITRTTVRAIMFNACNVA